MYVRHMASFSPHNYLRRTYFNRLLELVQAEYGINTTPFMHTYRRMKNYVMAKNATIALMKAYGWSSPQIELLTGVPSKRVSKLVAEHQKWAENQDYLQKFNNVDKKFMELLKKSEETEK